MGNKYLILIVATAHMLNRFSVVAMNDQTLTSSLHQDEEKAYLESEKFLETLKEHDLRDPKVSGLVKLSEDHESKCGILNLEEIIFLLDNYPHDSEKMKNFKRQQWNKRVAACKESWKKHLVDDVKTLTEDEAKLANSLKTNIKKSIPDFDCKTMANIDKSKDFLNNGVFSYFKQNIEHDLQQLIIGDNRKQLYKSDFAKLFTNLCGHVYIKLRRSMDYFELLENHPETGFDNDEFVVNWVENFKICQLVMKKDKAISKSLNHLLKSKNPNPSVGDKIRNCFSGQCKKITA